MQPRLHATNQLFCFSRGLSAIGRLGLRVGEPLLNALKVCHVHAYIRHDVCHHNANTCSAVELTMQRNAARSLAMHAMSICTLHKFWSPTGTWQNTTGSSSLADCLPCPPGRYCPHARRVQITTESKHGLDAATVSSPFHCLRPHSCPVVPFKCLPGTYQQDSNQTQCAVKCPAGKMCPEGTIIPQNCRSLSFM